MSLKSCPNCGYVTLAQTCPPCRGRTGNHKSRAMQIPPEYQRVDLRPAKRLAHARDVADRLLKKARHLARVGAARA